MTHAIKIRLTKEAEVFQSDQATEPSDKVFPGTHLWELGYEVFPESDTLPYLQEGVGGLVDVVTVSTGFGEIDVWIDDEGLLKQSFGNPLVSALVGGVLYGNVVITGEPDDEGNTLGLGKNSFLGLWEVLSDAVNANPGFGVKDVGEIVA